MKKRAKFDLMNLCAAMLPMLYVVGALTFLTAQESPNGNDKAQDTTWIRSWAVLGDVGSSDKYSLVYAPEPSKAADQEQKFVFSGVRGCYRSGFSKGYFPVPSGKYKFSLLRDGDDISKAVSIQEDFKKDTAYTLLAVIDDGTPALRLIPEFPMPPEQDGIYVWNLINEAPLSIQLGEGSPIPVPYSVKQPSVIPASRAAGGTATLIYPSQRKNEIRMTTPYSGRGRLSVVFMRNNSSRPTVFVYPSEPDKN